MGEIFTSCKEMERAKGQEVVFRCKALGVILKFEKFGSTVIPQQCPDCPARRANVADETGSCFVQLESYFAPRR